MQGRLYALACAFVWLRPAGVPPCCLPTTSVCTVLARHSVRFPCGDAQHRALGVLQNLASCEDGRMAAALLPALDSVSEAMWSFEGVADVQVNTQAAHSYLSHDESALSNLLCMVHSVTSAA